MVLGQCGCGCGYTRNDPSNLYIHGHDPQIDWSMLARLSIVKDKEVYFDLYGRYPTKGKKPKSTMTYPSEFRSIKPLIRNRDLNVCCLCNNPPSQNKALSVHHIDYDKQNADENNLISLCSACHAKTNHSRDKWQSLFAVAMEYQKVHSHAGHRAPKQLPAESLPISNPSCRVVPQQGHSLSFKVWTILAGSPQEIR